MIHPTRRAALLLTLASALLPFGGTAQAAQPQAQAASEPKVLRYAFLVAETGFDPTQLSDVYSRMLTGHIFEGLYTYDPLARPARIVPLLAAGEPEISSDYRSFTIRLKPGIYFADDPAFKGRRREVTAEDFVYSFKRFADPALKAQGWSTFEEAGLVGLAELRSEVLKSKKPFPYDTVVEGLRTLDRYTIQLKTREARPRLVELLLTGSDLTGALAREVVEHYGDKITEHPVGTGPFRLKSWRRSSQIVLERNPGYRERFYEGRPAADDAQGQALLARFKGRRIPMIDRVEISIIEESQPRWLSFLNHQHDFIERVPAEFIAMAVPGGSLAPNLAKDGVQAERTISSDVLLTVFNMDDPVVGGMAPEKVALRRAISLAIDIPREIRLVRRGQAIPAQSLLVPYTTGYQPEFKSEMGDFDPARAKALLDLYGYVDKDGDGWRDLPDGSPLVIRRNTQSDGPSRQLDEVFDKNLRAVGIKLELKVQQWPENLKTVRSGNFMLWGVGSLASQPDGQGVLQRLYSPATGTQNLARFKLPEFDRLYDRLQGLPDGPEREAGFLEAKRIGAAYMPYKAHAHRILTDLSHAWLIGYRRPLFWLDWWQFVDIDVARQREAIR